MERLVRLPRRANYFFALRPDPVAAASADRKARALRNWLGLSGPLRGEDKYHVTLWGWPRYWEPDGQELALMRQAGQSIEQAAFMLSFDEVATFAQSAARRALVMTGRDTVIGADRLHDALDRTMRASGVRAPRASHRPHLTLLYDRLRSGGFWVQPLSWRVTEFVLIRSVPNRPYEILGRWPLANP